MLVMTEEFFLIQSLIVNILCKMLVEVTDQNPKELINFATDYAENTMLPKLDSEDKEYVLSNYNDLITDDEAGDYVAIEKKHLALLAIGLTKAVWYLSTILGKDFQSIVNAVTNDAKNQFSQLSAEEIEELVQFTVNPKQG